MIGLFCFALAVLASPFRSKARLEAENAVLRHQLIVLRRRPRGRVRLTNHDRWFFIQLYRWFPAILKVLTIIRPETLVRWHRAGFRCYWRWKSRPLGGRPQIETELRVLIRRMSVENPLWGAPRIHGELLKLGFEVAQSTVAKHMVKRRGPPSQGWCTFLRSHAPSIAAMDLFVVPTIGFKMLYALIDGQEDRIVTFAIEESSVWSIATPKLQGSMSGAGDLFTALFVSALIGGSTTAVALTDAVSSTFAVLEETVSASAEEMRIVTSASGLLHPPVRFSPISSDG